MIVNYLSYYTVEHYNSLFPPVIFFPVSVCMCGVQMAIHDSICLGAHVCDCTHVHLYMKVKSWWQGSSSVSLHCFNWGRFSGWTWICSTSSLASQLPRTPANEDRLPYPPIRVSLLYGQHLIHWARSPVRNCFVVGFRYPLLTSLHPLSILPLLASIHHVYEVGILTFFVRARACSICPASEVS